MYWLLDFEEQDRIREVILALHDSLAEPHKRVQEDQTFPFVGRKDRGIASTIIEALSPEGGLVCDPFAGSGTAEREEAGCRQRRYTGLQHRPLLRNDPRKRGDQKVREQPDGGFIYGKLHRRRRTVLRSVPPPWCDAPAEGRCQ